MRTQQPKRETPEQAARREERNKQMRLATAMRNALEGWHTVAEYPSESNSRGAKHTVSFNGTAYQCSCQDFRIRAPKGMARYGDKCKHIRRYEQTRDPGVFGQD